MKRRQVYGRACAASLLAAAALLLAGCTQQHFHPGPPGTTVGRSTHKSCHTTGTGLHQHTWCSTTYKLTTRASDGSTHEFKAPRTAYERCAVDAAYPKCASRS